MVRQEQRQDGLETVGMRADGIVRHDDPAQVMQTVEDDHQNASRIVR